VAEVSTTKPGMEMVMYCSDAHGKDAATASRSDLLIFARCLSTSFWVSLADMTADGLKEFGRKDRTGIVQLDWKWTQLQSIAPNNLL
jgi:hypothetical protein